MNANFDMAYLDGGDDIFGPNYGGATVYTNVRAGYTERMPECRQAAEEPQVHAGHGKRDHGRDPRRRREPADAAKAWLKVHPATFEAWLDGVTTRDGGDAMAAVKGALGL
jgi:glycine betaine/proline transport system substrate-binding protein